MNEEALSELTLSPLDPALAADVAGGGIVCHGLGFYTRDGRYGFCLSYSE